MSQRGASDGLHDKAAQWAVRIDAGLHDAAAQSELATWLSQDPRHSGALLRAQAGLVLLSRSTSDQESPLSAADDLIIRTPILSRLLPFGIGAAIAASLAVFVTFQAPEETYTTQVGEQRRVALADGSIAFVNTDSEISVDYTSPVRRIALERGEAWFEVAEDKGRAFIVDAGPTHVKATGTAFSVRRSGQETDVIVTEGQVVTWTDARPEARLGLAAGQRVKISPRAPRMPIKVSENVLAWREGELVFDGETVASAAAEINRYNQRKVIVTDSRIAETQLVGLFRTHEVEKFAKSVALITQSSVKYNGNNIVIEK